jgi:SAM-dependent methyltransferase
MRRLIKFLLKYIPRPFLIRISLIFSKPISIFYIGDKQECPICEKKFRKFLPYGYKQTHNDNRLCPNCLSLERHRLLWMYLKNNTDFFTNHLKVLNIAPEQPYIKRFRKLNNLVYTTADLESPIADVKLDVRDMHVFEDNTFDFIICNHVLEHIDEEHKAMSELYRVLKKGGRAILQVPIDYTLEHTFEDNTISDKKERERIFGQYDHVRIYGRDYPERLKIVGFTVIEDDFVKRFSEEELGRYRLDQSEIIYLCIK